MQTKYGKVLKFTVGTDKDCYVLVVIIGDQIDFYTGYESIGDLTHSFGERYTGDTDEKIESRVNELYKAGYFHWAYYENGKRVEEELTEDYLFENKEPEIIFDEWVQLNRNTDDLIGGNGINYREE